jgi:hypothetical protein
MSATMSESEEYDPNADAYRSWEAGISALRERHNQQYLKRPRVTDMPTKSSEGTEADPRAVLRTRLTEMRAKLIEMLAGAPFLNAAHLRLLMIIEDVLGVLAPQGWEVLRIPIAKLGESRRLETAMAEGWEPICTIPNGCGDSSLLLKRRVRTP